MTRRFLLLGTAAGFLACSPAEPTVDPERSYLTDEQRLELFDLERADVLLGRALKPFTAAVTGADEAGIRGELADGFKAHVPEVPALTATGDQPCGLRKVESFRELDADGFVAWAKGLGEHFSRVDTVWFGRIYNSHEIIEGPGAIATAKGAFRIAGRGKDAGPLELAGEFVLRHQGFARLAEDEEVEDAEVHVERWIHELSLDPANLVASRAPLFADATADSGIDVDAMHDNWIDTDRGLLIFTGGSYLGDVDGDGHLDLLVTDILRSWLYLGNGDGTFRDSGWEPEPAHVKTRDGRLRVLEPHGALLDATGNGRTDILHAGKLYSWNERKGEIVQRTKATPLPNGDASLADYDRDGLVDLYFLNTGPYAEKREENVWFDDERTNGRRNQLFRNLGGGKFQNVTGPTHASPGYGRTFAASWFYANEDDWPDLFGANEFGRNDFLVNDRAVFRECDDVDPVFGGFSMGVSSGDIDGDGRTDLYVSNMYSKAGQRVYHHLDMSIYPESARKMFMASVLGNRLYHSRGDLTFENVSAYSGGYAVGWGFSGAVLDVDLDGWLDLYAPCGYISIDRTKPDG